MSTSPTPLVAPNSNPGFFSRIGAFLKTAAPYITPIADRLAAAAGNYTPMKAERQQREDALRQSQFQLQSQLQQSQLQNQDLQRQLTQKQLDNYQTPDQQAQRAIDIKRAETPTTYQTDEGQTGIADTDLKGVTSPRMVNVPNPEVGMVRQRNNDFNQTFPGKALPMAPPTMPATVQRPATMPQSVGFHVQGYDASGNPVVAEFGKNGAPIGNVPGPTPANVAVPTSPWKTYLEAGRRQGMSDADIVNRWNSQESQRTNVKLVPQPDGTISAVPVTPAQMQSMIKLAQDRADQDYQSYQRAQSAARSGYGMNGVPNAGTNAPPAGPLPLPKVPPRTADEYLNSLPH